jgi:hypothetical protein
MLQSYGIGKLTLNRLGSPGGLIILTPGNAPTNLIAEAISSTAIRLTWTDNSTSEEGFSIERSPNGIDTWAEFYTTAEGIIIKQDDDCTDNTEYWYRVRAFLGAEYSEYSNIAYARTHQKIFLHNTTSNVIVGNITTNLGLIITYSAIRGALRQSGQIYITSGYLDEVLTNPLQTYNFDDVGLTFTADYSGNDIRLQIIADNMDANNITFYYLIEEITGTKSLIGFPDPDALYNVRSDLTITDQIRGRTLSIGYFPHMHLHTSLVNSERWDSNHVNTPSDDWTVIWFCKIKSINNNYNVYLLNGGANNAIFSRNQSDNTITFLLNINSLPVGNLNFVSSYGEWLSDFLMFGASYNKTTKLAKKICKGIVFSSASVGANEPTSSNLGMYTTMTQEHNESIGCLKYNRELTDAELLLANSGIYPADSLDYLCFFNNDKRSVYYTYERDMIDGVRGAISTLNFPVEDTIAFDYKNNSIFSKYLLVNGFTQRDTHQIPYLPDKTKSITPSSVDYECPSDSVIHNLASSYINGNPNNHSMDWSMDDDKLYAIWDKSNRTIWKASIETANEGVHYIPDDNGNYTLWNPLDELNQDFINIHAETGHDGHIFVGLRTSGVYVTGLTQIAVYKNNLS